MNRSNFKKGLMCGRYQTSRHTTSDACFDFITQQLIFEGSEPSQFLRKLDACTIKIMVDEKPITNFVVIEMPIIMKPAIQICSINIFSTICTFVCCLSKFAVFMLFQERCSFVFSLFNGIFLVSDIFSKNIFPVYFQECIAILCFVDLSVHGVEL